MATKDVKIRVSQQGAAKASQGLKKVDNSLLSLGKSAGLAAVAYFGVRGLINAFKGSIEAAGTQEMAEKKLATALGKTSDALLKQASALQQVTMFGDEDIIMMQSMLAAFTDNEEEIQKLTVATLDLASGMGLDLKSAGDLVAKTIGSSTNAMSRYGIEVNGAVGSTQRLESLTNNVANLFGGQASAQAETMTGAIQQMKNAVGDAAEVIGSLLGPTVIKAANALKSASEFTSDFLTGLKNLKEFGDTGGLEAVKEKNDETRESYEKLSKALAIYRGTAFALGMDIKKLSKESLTNNEDEKRSKREQVEFFKAAIEEEVEAQRGKSIELRQDQTLTLENLKEIELTEEQNAVNRKLRADSEVELQKTILRQKEKEKKVKTDLVIADLKNAALQQTSAGEAMKAAVRAETMEAVAGYIASVLKSVPFPLNVGLAAAGGTFVGGLVDKALSNFATGGDFVTSGPQMIMVGDNPGGKERVQVTPIGSPNVNGPQGGINVNFSGPVTNDDYVRDFIIPEINKATRLDLA